MPETDSPDELTAAGRATVLALADWLAKHHPTTEQDIAAAALLRLQVGESKLTAIRNLHEKELFGDCVEDGETFPCKTVRILDWEPTDAAETTEVSEA